MAAKAKSRRDMVATVATAVTPRVTAAVARRLATTAMVVVGPASVVAAATGAIAIVPTVVGVSSVADAIAIVATVAMVAMVAVMPLPKPTLRRLPSLLIRLSRASSGLRLVSVRFTSAARIAERYDKLGPNGTMSLAVG